MHQRPKVAYFVDVFAVDFEVVDLVRAGGWCGQLKAKKLVRKVFAGPCNAKGTVGNLPKTGCRLAAKLELLHRLSELRRHASLVIQRTYFQVVQLCLVSWCNSPSSQIGSHHVPRDIRAIVRA